MSEISNTTSSRLANMGLLCAVLVVFQHVGHDLPHESLGWWVQNVLGGGISRVAVPFFFLASGFFLAGHFNECGWWQRAIIKRCRTLLVPLLFWSVFGMFWGALWTALANHLAGRPIGDSIPLFHGEWVPGVGILWFIRTLFCLVVVSPLLLWIVRRFGCLAVVGLFAVYWLGNSFVVPQCASNLGDFLFYGVSFEGIAYFSLGLFLRENYQALDLKDSSTTTFPRVTICGLATVAMIALYFSICCCFKGGGLDMRHYHYPLTMMMLWSIVPAHRWPKWLVGSSFAIYVLHCQVNVVGQIVVKRLAFAGDVGGYFLRWAIAVVMSILVANGLKRMFPRFAAIVFGGR